YNMFNNNYNYNNQILKDNHIANENTDITSCDLTRNIKPPDRKKRKRNLNNIINENTSTLNDYMNLDVDINMDDNLNTINSKSIMNIDVNNANKICNICNIMVLNNLIKCTKCKYYSCFNCNK